MSGYRHHAALEELIRFNDRLRAEVCPLNQDITPEACTQAWQRALLDHAQMARHLISECRMANVRSVFLDGMEASLQRVQPGLN
ncbi:hypothetical protein ATDW_08740 [Asticcacaulis sp. DW145]|jgi:hypothetical protein|uniref:Uncharacterized protein n=1 Tax=Asticcacaulis currens TaxID=2984210 RepID=A0ABT5IBS9_9CAUL|nr:hypothetical protein [Asticcacaulis currens]MDC7693652.1 hypothetical protein [Asticcacaulis currens]BEV10378.1 hypothetical protein ATDW_08740 [Asticcacaulis sp. DW145]